MEFGSVSETHFGETDKHIHCESTAIRETGFPSAGHLRIARIRWTIPQVNFVCAVSVPLGGAHEETFKGYGT